MRAFDFIRIGLRFLQSKRDIPSFKIIQFVQVSVVSFPVLWSMWDSRCADGPPTARASEKSVLVGGEIFIRPGCPPRVPSRPFGSLLTPSPDVIKIDGFWVFVSHRIKGLRTNIRDLPSVTGPDWNYGCYAVPGETF